MILAARLTCCPDFQKFASYLSLFDFFSCPFVAQHYNSLMYRCAYVLYREIERTNKSKQLEEKLLKTLKVNSFRFFCFLDIWF